MKILKRFSQTWLRKELTNNLSAFFCWLCIPSTLRTRMSLLPSPASSTPTHPPQRWNKVLNKVSTTGHLLLLCYNKDDLQPRHLCLWAASQVSSSNGLLHQHQYPLILSFDHEHQHQDFRIMVDSGFYFRSIYLWFCLASTLLVGMKTIVNLRCLLFSLALPGFCGRCPIFLFSCLVENRRLDVVTCL